MVRQRPAKLLLDIPHDQLLCAVKSITDPPLHIIYCMDSKLCVWSLQFEDPQPSKHRKFTISVPVSVDKCHGQPILNTISSHMDKCQTSCSLRQVTNVVIMAARWFLHFVKLKSRCHFCISLLTGFTFLHFEVHKNKSSLWNSATWPVSKKVQCKTWLHWDFSKK